MLQLSQKMSFFFAIFCLIKATHEIYNWSFPFIPLKGMIYTHRFFIRPYVMISGSENSHSPLNDELMFTR